MENSAFETVLCRVCFLQNLCLCRLFSFTLCEKCLHLEFFLVRTLPAFMLNTVICSIYLRVQSKYGKIHYIKSVGIQSFSGPYFPTFGLSTERKCGHFSRSYIGDKENSEYGHFHVVTYFTKFSVPWKTQSSIYVNVEDFFKFWTSPIILVNFYKIFCEYPSIKQGLYRKLILDITTRLWQHDGI